MRTSLALLLVSALPWSVPGVIPSTTEHRELPLADGRTLEYELQLPAGYDPERAYPLVLALPPGDQSADMVAAGMDLYWSKAGFPKGWIVASPVAPEGVAFFRGSEETLVELLDSLERDHRVAGGRAHVAGPSNGGRSAFRLGIRHPERIASLTVLPGFPPTEEDRAALDRLQNVPIAMFAGGDDPDWVEASKTTLERLQAGGHPEVSLQVFPGEGHVPQSATPELIFATLERFHGHLMAEAAHKTEVRAALDDFHLAAAAADGPRYFGHFAPGAVFLGTDASERWTIPQFRAYAEPFFSKGQGWSYTPTERSVDVSYDGRIAWFDERLDNQKYGEVRGSGVLVRYGERWLLAQYNLAFPVPNALAEDLVRRIRGE